MPGIEISQAARADLDDIWSYIAADNVAAADRFLERLYSRCISYAYQPYIGETYPAIGSNVRRFSVEQYVVYYQPQTEGIELIRVIHGGRNFRQL